MRLKSHYRDEEAQKHQEVVTPPELVEHIYSFLEEKDFKNKDILEPCVGPGALIEPIIDNMQHCDNSFGINSLTIMDIQPIHVENIIKKLKIIKKQKKK
jgi:hypothetical protein